MRQEQHKVFITGTIITLNEEKNIIDCINSMKLVCNEIVVVDSLSSDSTVELAKTAGARVIKQNYLGDGPQRILAAENSTNDWILCLDADERLSQKAIDGITSLDLTCDDFAYAFPRRSYVGTHWIKAAGFHPDFVTRLYNRKTAQYLKKRAHTSVSAKHVKKLKGHLEHYTYLDYTDWIKRINELSSRDAWAKAQLGKQCSKGGAAARAVFALFKKLFLKRAIFQGGDGWMISITSMFHVYMKYLKLYEINQTKKMK